MNLFLFTPYLVFIGTVAVIIAVFWFLRFTRRGRRTPLTRQLLRMPGETLRQKIDDLGDDFSSYFIIAVSSPILFYSLYLAFALTGKITSFTVIFLSISAMVPFFVILRKMWKIAKERNALRLGLDCELAVGQELNQLMLEGCRVYHDFPADKFNIDHIVVGPKGVFAVETKGRAKADKKGGAEEAKVSYDGDKLNFPGWSEGAPLHQAKRQAIWLSQWLSSAVGESVSVKPVLALPGWYIDRKKPSDLLIFNGKNPELLLKWSSNADLSESLVKRIAHQLEQRCRDIEPVAYSKKK
jgi:hypothetical protein